MSNDCTTILTGEGLTKEEQLNIFRGIWNGNIFADSFKEMTDQTSHEVCNNDGKMELTITTHNEPPLDDLVDLSKAYPKSIFSLIYMIEEDSMFGASTAINGNWKDDWVNDFDGDILGDEQMKQATNWITNQTNQLKGAN